MDRTLWVDAVCIDQSDTMERSRQVEIMQEIYMSAKQVIVWLGEESAQDSLALNSLNQLKNRLGLLRPLVRLGWYRDKKAGRAFSGGADRSILIDIEYEHLISLLYRDWFHRTWVIQEVASAREAIVLCGGHKLRWETFAAVYMRLGDHFFSVSQSGSQTARHALENISAIENARRSRSGALFMPLFHILLATSSSQCVDPRDKIYAVKGLAKDWMHKRGLEKNYTASFETLFKKFAIADVNRNLNLRILSCPSERDEESKVALPSWTPDWRKIDNAHPFVRYSEYTKFRASNEMKAEAWHSHDQNVLHVRGKWVDSVAVLGPQSSFTKTIDVFEINERKIAEIGESFKWLQECETLASNREGFITPERQEELGQTLTCGLTGDGLPAPKHYSKYFLSYMKFMATARKRFADFLLKARSSPDGFKGLIEAIPGFETHRLIEESISKWASTRRFCQTTSGALACVPKSARNGDIICILFGGEVPYLLRPRGPGFFRVIGECYVHGIMHGEGLSHDTEVVEFRLA